MLPTGWQSTGVQVESGQSWLYQVRRSGSGDALFALKRLKDPRRSERFAREVETMIALQSRGIAVPEIVAQEFAADRPWFVMPWFPDGSLEDAVQDRRFVDDRVAGLQLLQLLVSTLSDVHAAEIAHRDLKPANVLLDADSLALTDFGLCLEVPEAGLAPERVTETWEAVGSRHYIAPENEGGFNAAQDQRPTDFYAFGKLMRALLAGAPPLPREQDLEDSNALSRVLDPRLAPLDLLLRELLNRDPRARLADWSVAIDELRAVEADLGGRQREAPRAIKADLFRIARRVRTAPRLTKQLEEASIEQRQWVWYRDLAEAMAQRARTVTGSLEGLQAELAGLLELYPTVGAALADEMLRNAGLPAPPGPAAPVDPSRAATTFLLHSPSAVAGLPAIAIRVWPVCDADSVWFVRVPVMSIAGAAATVPAFLTDAIYGLVGPFPAFRQTTVQHGLDFVDEAARLFLSVVEQYVRVLDDDEHPGEAASWAERIIEPVEIQKVDTGGDIGDATPPELIEFALAPASGTDPADPTITVRARIGDERSGIGDGGLGSPSQARLRSPSRQLRDALFMPRTRIAGDEHDGIYSTSFTLNEHAERGLWRVEYVMLVDNAGNRRDYRHDELTALAFPTSILVR